jgi:signal transduction histidine kinase
VFGMNVVRRVHAATCHHPHADLGIAVVVFAVTLLTTVAGPGGQPVDGLALVAAATASGALAARQHAPFAALAVSAIAAEVYLAAMPGHVGLLVVAAPLIALYTVAERSTRRRATIIGALAVLAFGGLHSLVKPASWLGAENVALAALGGLAIAAGNAARIRRAYLAEVEARARDAEADREAEAARRVTDERLRIARDLHDHLGHHLALIYLQAGVATHVLPDPPERAADALAHIRAASKTALTELGDTIGLLRRPDDPAAPTEPAPGLAGIEELLAAFRRSGLSITEQIEGPASPLPVATDLVAYRVIQESLTNVRKHAGPTAVALRLTCVGDGVRIVVENTNGGKPSTDGGAPGGTTRTGHGLVGMRERVSALGGSLQTGPRPAGGYRVSAVLPLAGRP